MNIEDTLTNYIREQFVRDNPDIELEADYHLLTSGLIDSLGVMRLVGFIEDAFGTDVPPTDLTIEHFRSIRTITAYIESRTKPAATLQE